MSSKQGSRSVPQQRSRHEPGQETLEPDTSNKHTTNDASTSQPTEENGNFPVLPANVLRGKCQYIQVGDWTKMVIYKPVYVSEYRASKGEENDAINAIHARLSSLEDMLGLGLGLLAFMAGVYFWKALE